MAKKVIFWESDNGQLYETEKEAFEADILHLGGDDVFFNSLVDRLEQCNEKIEFNLETFPTRISYRLMYAGYVGQLYTSVSNAEFSNQYSIYFYKLGVKPKHQLNMVIEYEKNEEYKKIYGSSK